MKKPLLAVMAIALSLFLFSFNTVAADPKEWTFLVFLNGHNNLDPFGEMNVKQMEEVGSSDKVNVIVQWASLAKGKTKRLYVKKGQSDVIEEMSPVDMGDYHQLVEFVKWAQQKFPAKKYFIDVWNHGNGWHLSKKGIRPSDISYDDRTGNKITTEQLGQAMKEIAAITGSKVELYASDACLMSMAEVASEMKDSVSYFAGSQEVEPGDGWPYSKILERWMQKPEINGAELGKILSEEYLKAYTGGVYGESEVTFSAMDLSRFEDFEHSVKGLVKDLKALPEDRLQKSGQAARDTQSFTGADYKDVVDFLNLAQAQGVMNRRLVSSLDHVKEAMSHLILSNSVTQSYKRSHGLSIWLPTRSWQWDDYGQRYMGLKFHQATGWGDFAQLIGKMDVGL